MKSKFKALVAGFVMGSLCMLTVGVFADGNFISAVRGDYVKFKFDGVSKLVPTQDYSTPAIVYEDRVYVAARYVAEQLGATVNWNPTNTTVEITSPEPKVVEKEVIKEVIKEVPAVATETRTYSVLPIKKENADFSAEVTGIYGDKKDETYTKIYLSLKSNPNSRTICLDYEATEIEVDGVKYSVKDVNQIYRDDRWYNNVAEGGSLEGYIIIKAIPEDAKYIHMKLKTDYNDGRNQYENYEYNFKVE